MEETTAFGRYRLESLLGRGGMGEVWKAYDTSMNRIVALKVLPANFADDEQFQARFRREAQMAAGLDEPHVVPIHDSGEIDGRLYVTMRLIDGKTIHELLENGPLAPHRAVWIVEQIAAALNAAHRVGLVHRDVKPSNILVTEEDFAYLIDFGIARVAGGTKLTNTGTTVGTLAYMAPERFSSDTADARADIYALTCVLHECLTGSQPFPGDSLERQLAGHLTMAPPRPSTMQPGVSPQMDQVIAKGMAKNPEERFATTKDLAAAARAALTMPVPPAQPAPAPSWPAPAPLPYPGTAPNAPSAAVPTQHWAPSEPAPWPPIPMPPGAPQPPGVGPQPSGRSSLWIPAALIGGLLAVVIAVVVVAVILIGQHGDQPTARQVASTTAPGSIPPMSFPTFTMPSGFPSLVIPTPSTGNGPTKLQTVDGLNALLASIREKFGDTMGFRLVVYPDYASLDRTDPKDKRRKQTYDYRNGAWTESIIAGSVSTFDVLADLAKFDTAAVIPRLQEAPKTFDLPNPELTYLIVEGESGGSLGLSAYVSDRGLSGYLELNPDGTVKASHPPS